MSTAQERVIVLLVDASKALLNAMQDKDHSLARCTTKVRKLLEQGCRHGEMGEYKEAITCFREAAALDPKYIGARLRMIKAYRNSGHHAKALYVGGAAIMLSENPQIRSQIFDLLGRVAKDIFDVTPTRSHLEDAIEFYNEAINEDATDIVPRWNLVCAYLDGARFAEDFSMGDKEEHLRRAERCVGEVIGLLRLNKGDGLDFLAAIILDADSKFDGLGERWQQHLRELRRIGASNELGGTRFESPFKPHISSGDLIRGALTAAAMAMAIAGATIATLSDGRGIRATPTSTVEATVGVALPAQSDSATNHVVPRIYKIDPSIQEPLLVEVDRDWKKLAELERDWTRLA